jgi:hypothetical protein
MIQAIREHRSEGDRSAFAPTLSIVGLIKRRAVIVTAPIRLALKEGAKTQLLMQLLLALPLPQRHAQQLRVAPMLGVGVGPRRTTLADATLRAGVAPLAWLTIIAVVAHIAGT